VNLSLGYLNVNNWHFFSLIYPVLLQYQVHLLNRLLFLSSKWCKGAVMVVIVCNRCLSPLTLWVRIPLMVRCTWYNIIWKRLSVTCDRSVVFSGYIGFLHQLKWPPRYNWNIVECVKHHNPNPQWRKKSIQIYSVSPFLWFGNWNLWYHMNNIASFFQQKIS
jgi:hypothetical protein